MFSSNAPRYQFVEYGYENTEKRFCKISEELVVTFQTLSHGLHKSWFAQEEIIMGESMKVEVWLL